MPTRSSTKNGTVQRNAHCMCIYIVSLIAIGQHFVSVFDRKPCLRSQSYIQARVLDFRKGSSIKGASVTKSSLVPKPNVMQLRVDYITAMLTRSGDVIHPQLRNVGSGYETTKRGGRGRGVSHFRAKRGVYQSIKTIQKVAS